MFPYLFTKEHNTFLYMLPPVFEAIDCSYSQVYTSSTGILTRTNSKNGGFYEKVATPTLAVMCKRKFDRQDHYVET